MITYIANYKEFNDEKNAPSVAEGVRKTEVPKKHEILKYMKSFEADVVCPALVRDEVTKKETKLTLIYYTDGEFLWDERVIYHFDKYNISLNEDFLKKIS